MKKLRLGFIDTFKAMENFVIGSLQERFDIEIDNDDPEFLIFCDENFGTSNLRFSKECVRIFMTGENRRPENYKCHYAVTFDYNSGKWHFRFPLAILEMFSMQFDRPDLYTVDYINNIQKHPDPFNREFCGFVHRNGANGVRNGVFKYISENYKKIDSAGPLFNNTGYLLDSLQDKIEWQHRKKFTLCFENSSHPGYVTEKILHAFYSNTIPIYCGDPTVDLIFNPASFVDAANVKDVGELLAIIKYLDENEQAYMWMLNQPPIKHNIPIYNMYSFNFVNWFESVVFEKKFMRAI